MAEDKTKRVEMVIAHEVLPSTSQILDDLTISLAYEAARLAKKAKENKPLTPQEVKTVSEFAKTLTIITSEQDKQKQRAFLSKLSDDELLELLQKLAPKLLEAGNG